MTNGCPVCLGLGRIVAYGAAMQPLSVPCPECAGLATTPASAEDDADNGPIIEQSKPKQPSA